MSKLSADADLLLSPQAVRSRAKQVLEIARRDELEHWHLQEDRLGEVTQYVCELTRASYPDLQVPFHSRWRHLELEGQPLWPDLQAAAGSDWGRTATEMIILSVLLDAGAGPTWRYQPEQGPTLGRSEGLALAAFDLYERGGFHHERKPHALAATAAGLQGFTEDHLKAGFQVTGDNPLVGVAGRCQLVRSLGDVVASNPIFTRDGTARLGHFHDAMLALATNGSVAAPDVLQLVLQHLGPIWPSRLDMDGVPLGDVWPLAIVDGPGKTNGLMPFHKLSQWLTYSLLDALIMTGTQVIDVDAMTGLPEYRNGGLLIDFEVLVPKSPSLLTTSLTAADEPIVAWRALTVALLDEIGRGACELLGKSASEFPLACVLQGGTWTAGRKIAAVKREGGLPPLNIVSDGTVF